MGDKNDILAKCTGFDWDKANAVKIREKHGVEPAECEELFFNRPLVVADDKKHSQKEARFYTLGQTDRGRLLFTVFTVRANKIRVISARDMSRKERKVYDAYEEDS